VAYERCPSCETEVEEDAAFCPECGEDMAGEVYEKKETGSESFLDAVQRPTPTRWVKGIAGTMASVGAFISIGVFLIAELGGRSLMPGAVQTFEGGQVGQMITTGHQLTLAYVTNEIAIFLSFLMAPTFGALVAFRMEETNEAKIATAGTGVAVGAFAFVLIVGFVSSVIVPPPPPTMTSGMNLGSIASGTGAVSNLNLGSLDFGNLIINSILVAIPAGIGAATTVYFDDKYFE
jgi:hypothetical protein